MKTFLSFIPSWTPLSLYIGLVFLGVGFTEKEMLIFSFAGYSLSFLFFVCPFFAAFLVFKSKKKTLS
ncbi:MAG: hypothetical protein ACRBCS_15805 [Cellvibrionaceae bacterium]